MPKSAKKTVVTGRQLPTLDASGMALLLRRFARQRQLDRQSSRSAVNAPSPPDAGAAA